MDILAQIQALVIALQDAQLALEAEKKLAYDSGYAVGFAAAGGASDKLYSQEELEQKLQAEVGPLKDKVAELEAKVLALEAGQLEAVAAAVAAKQAEMVADFEAAQVDDAAFLAKYKA